MNNSSNEINLPIIFLNGQILLEILPVVEMNGQIVMKIDGNR
jgi:hypothetical protein